MQIKKIIYYLGIDANPVSHLEKIISGIGGFLSIFSIIYISSLYVGVEAVYVIPSMGASAVLLFAAPHSALGQLWNVIGGHLISAAIGVTCARQSARRNRSRSQCRISNSSDVLCLMSSPSRRRNSFGCGDRRTKHFCFGI